MINKLHLRNLFAALFICAAFLQLPIASLHAAPTGSGGQTQSATDVTEVRSTSAILPSPKTIIFYSSVGMGHLSAARAIEASIKAKDPKALIVLKDITDFEGRIANYLITQKGYWFLVKNYPNIFDRMFRAAMTRGNQVQHLSQMEQTYDQDGVLRFIMNQNPTSIIATHYGSATVLGNLREKGQLANIPIAWLHTDYFKGFFPRISKRIERTYVGMNQVREMWLKEGVDEDKVLATGIPVNPAVFTPVDREGFLKSKGLDPQVKTVVIATGGEGVGNFELIVDKLAKEMDGPLQVVAICARSEKNYDALEKLKPKLRQGVTLQVHKMIPNVDLLSYVKSSDVYITKSGGLSPTEAFAITKPTVLLDVYGGHERDNAELFEREGLAIVNRDQAKIADDVKRILSDEEMRKKMLEMQLAFRNTINLEAIAEFAFETRGFKVANSYHLGIEGGEEVQLTNEALDKLENDSPADVEILLSYGKSRNGNYFGSGNESNPFGHLAIRVGNKLYTTNGRAQPGHEDHQVHETTLRDYLYSAQRPEQNMEMTDAFGNSYGRDNLSVRVQGLKPEQLQAMHDEVAKIQQGWREGTVRYHNKENNCADTVIQILRAGGLDPQKIAKFDKPKTITLPVDTFDIYREYFEDRTDIRTEIVAYNQVRDANSMYTSTRFPLSFHQLKRMVKNMFLRKLDPVELRAGKRIAFYPNDRRAHYENVNGQSVAQEAQDDTKLEAEQAQRLVQLRELERTTELRHQELRRQGQTAGQLRVEMSATLASLNTSEKQLFLQGREAEISAAQAKAKALSLRTRIRAWDASQTAYQNAHDQMIQLELDYFIDGSFYVMNGLHRRAAVGLESEKAKALQVIFDRAVFHYRAYAKGRTHYGQPLDGLERTSPYREFFAALKDYMDAVNASPVARTPAVTQYWTWVASSLSSVNNKLRVISKVAPSAARVLISTMARPQSAAGEAPVTRNINRALTELGRWQGLRVNVQGRENLPQAGALDASKTVYVVAPTHRNPILDAIVMSHLGLDNSLLVMATDQFAPPALANRLDQVDNIITVGRGSDKPVQKILEQLERQKSNTIMIYPEGSIQAGLQETRPVREKFSWGLMQRLIKDGYNVKLLPVTYLDTARFAHENVLDLFAKPNGETTLNVRVHPAIDAQMISLLASSSDDQAIGRFLRATWMEDLGVDQQSLHGLLRVNNVTDRLQNGLGVNLNPAANSAANPAVTCESSMRIAN